MKRSLGIAFLMMAAVFAAACGWIPSIIGQKGEISIAEEVLEGDRDAAKGFSFRIGSEANAHLIWDTFYDPWEKKINKVSFRFSGPRDASVTDVWSLYERYEKKEPLDLLRSGSFHLTSSHSVSSGAAYSATATMTINAVAEIFPEAVQSVIDQTSTGASLTREVFPGDYYDYLPLELWLDYKDSGNRFVEVKGNVNMYGTGFDVGELLQIPVPEDYRLSVTVRLNDSRELEALEVDEIGDFWLYSSQISREEGCYFAFYLIDGEGRFLPIPERKGSGNGIYFVPATREDDRVVLWYDRIRKVCSLPEEACVVDLEEGNEADEILLVTLSDGEWRLDSMNVKDYSVSAGQPLLEADVPGSFLRVSEVLGGKLLMLGDGRFCMAQKEDGNYRSGIKGEIDSYGLTPETYFGNDPRVSYAAEYRDGKLALLGQVGSRRNSLYLYVFGENGLLYKGLYRHSGDLWTDSGCVYYDAWGNAEAFGFVEETGFDE